MYFKAYNPSLLSEEDVSHILLTSVAPRPVAIVTTCDTKQKVCLSSIDFFNIASLSPPVVVLSTCRKLRSARNKQMLQNIAEVPELVINLISHDIIQQATFIEYDDSEDSNTTGVSGLSMMYSDEVRPPRVLQSPGSLECRVRNVISIGSHQAASRLLICDITRVHMRESMLSEDGQIDQHELNLVARMGHNYYCHAKSEAIFEIKESDPCASIGINSLPEFILKNPYIEIGHLDRLGSLLALPTQSQWRSLYGDEYVTEILDTHSEMDDKREAIHLYANKLLADEDTERAARLLFLANEI